MKPGTVRPYLFVFVNCLIENPTFDSQTKETLTLPVKKFGSTCDLPDSFMKKGARDVEREVCKVMHAGGVSVVCLY